MDKYKKIEQLIKGFADKPVVFFPAVVESVQEDTCTVLVDKLKLSNVRLKPTTTVGSNYVLITPAIKSNVVVASLTGSYSNLFIVQADTIDKLECVISEDISLKIDKSEIVLNGGKNKGLVKIDKLVERINRLEDKLKKHQHGYAGPSAPALTTPALALTPPDFTLQFTNTKIVDLEDKKVKH